MYDSELKVCIEAGIKASKKVMEIYNDLSFKVETKDDDSPVTTADLAANDIIISVLSQRFPEYAILSEETADNTSRLTSDYLFVIDPIDGTKDFIAHNDEFCINIGLVHNHKAVVGVVLIPALDKIYYAVSGKGAYLTNYDGSVNKRISVSDKTSNLTVLTSRFFHHDEDQEMITKNSFAISKQETCGSAYKMCRIAEGSAELIYRMRPGTKEWDTAAPQIIIEEAGGLFLEIPSLKPLTYNRVNVKNVNPYIIVNRKENILL